MALLSSAIPNLINGVSQQPFTLRLASQAEEQINGLSSVAEGLRKRPPTKHVAKFSNTPTQGAFTHIINRDERERYAVTIKDGQISVIDLKGNPQVVKAPQGTAYLNTPNPEVDLQAVTVADYTFILNKSVKVAEDPRSVRGGNSPFMGVVWVKQGAYSTTYAIEVDGARKDFVTPYSGSTAAEQAASQLRIQTSFIAQELAAGLVDALRPRGFGIQRFGSTILFTHNNRDFAMSVYDALGDTSLKLVKNTVQTFSDLPARGIPGMKLRVAGSDNEPFDDYMVEFASDTENPNGGVWKEGVADGEVTGMLNATMPHLLVRDADGTFSFEEAVFDDREAGDSKSAPLPSFVGNRINAVVFHRNRLGFLSDENVVFSQAGEFFKFFRKSAIQTLDTDPIDVAVTTTKVSILKAAVPFNETLMLFSDQSQFQISKSDILTPKTVGVNLTTEFSCNTLAKPVGAGANVYFAQSRGGYSGIREYFVDPVTSVNDAVDVTAHCPTYIPGNIRKMTSSTNENTIVCLSDKERGSLFVYRYYWSQQTKLQSSWSKWVLPPGTEVLDCEFLNSTLVLVLSRLDGCYVETMELQSGVTDTDASYQVYLDRRIDQTMLAVRSVGFDEDERPLTYVELPMKPQQGEEYVFVAWAGDATYRPGEVIPHERVQQLDGRVTFVLKGNVTRFFAGVRYAFRYTFSPFIVREQSPGGQGMQAVTEGRLQIRHLRVAFNETGYFEARVTPSNGQTYRYPFTGRVLGSKSVPLGSTGLVTSQFQFPVASKNDQVRIELVNDSPLPCAFLSAEWEAFYTIRSRRM